MRVPLYVIASLLVVGVISSDMSVSVDREAAMNIVEDVVDFGKEYMSKTKDERKELMKQVCNAFRDTGAKLILNFGKTIAPMVEDWAQVMKHVQVNPECDQECASRCLDPKARNTMFFNKKCLTKCNC